MAQIANLALGGIGRGKAVIQQPAVQPGSSFSSQQQNGFASDSQNSFGGGQTRSGGGGGSFGGDSSFQTKENGPSSGGGFGGSAGGGFGGSSGGFGAESNGGGFGGGGGGGRGFGGGGERRGGGAGGGRACHKCGNEGHFARECPESGGGGGGGPRSRACFKCGQEGHRAAECPNAESGGGSDGFGNKSSGGGGFGGSGFNSSGGGGGFGGGNSGGGGGGFNSGDFDSSGGGGGGFRSKGFGGRDDNRKGGGFGGGNRDEDGGGGGFGGSSNKGFGTPGFGSGGDADGENRGGGGGGFGRSGGGFGGGGGGSGSGCRKCGEDGHIARNCPQGGGSGCRKCGKEGHIARECPEGGGPSNDDGCRRCGSKEHMVRDCPEPMKCFNCNEEGHQSKDCTKPRAANGEDGRKPAQTYQPKEVTEEDLIKIERIHSGINFEKYDNIKVQVTGSGQEVVPIQKFEDAGFTETVRDNVLKTQWNKPTPIQKYAIPIIMAGHDLMACAQTGSGKTAAYLLPVLSSMLKRGEMTSSTAQLQEPSAIIIAPTRELAIQISTEAKFFAHGTMVRVCLLYGGTNVKYQIEQIQRGCNVLVATPGRLNHFISEGRIGLSKCRYVILDEADRMLDMGFESEIRKIVQHANMPLIADRQTLMFSATFPEEIQKLAQDFLRPQFAFIAIGIVGGANADITQEFEQIDQYNKKDRLVELLTEDVKNSQPNADGKYSKKTLVFVERKRVADFIATYLSQMSFKSTSIHGDREQQQREEALNDFKSGRCPVLIATAVAARGLDIVGVDHVINYDLPNSIDDYVHRIGRTGRVGNPGRATSFFDSKTDEPLARQLVQILSDALQPVPEWMQSYAGGVQSFSTERSLYGGRDQRELDGGWNSGAAGAGFAGTTSLPASNDKWE